MKPLAIKIFSAAILVSVLFSCSKEDDGIYFNDNSEIIDKEVINNNVSYTEIEKDILTLVNEHRQNIGINPLSCLDNISGVADGHTDYMIETGILSHDNFNQRAEILMDIEGAKSVGENVAYGYNSAKGALEGWLKSDEHRKAIENTSYTHFGISSELNCNGVYYFTQIFIKK